MLVEWVDAQDREHGPHLAGSHPSRVEITGSERGITLARLAVNLGQRDRHRQVVVESRRETFGPRTEFDAARTLVCAQDDDSSPW